jgi:hypothetical protein
MLTHLRLLSSSILPLPPILLQPFLDAQLAAPSSSEGGSADQPAAAAATPQQHFTKEDLSTALLAAVAILPDLIDDVPKSPVLVAELIGHFLAGGQLSFSLGELAAAVREAGGCSSWLLVAAAAKVSLH